MGTKSLEEDFRANLATLPLKQTRESEHSSDSLDSDEEIAGAPGACLIRALEFNAFPHFAHHLQINRVTDPCYRSHAVMFKMYSLLRLPCNRVGASFGPCLEHYVLVVHSVQLAG